MKLNIFHFIFFLSSCLLSQNENIENINSFDVLGLYPEGIYESREDFLAKVPSTDIEIELRDYGKDRTDGIIVPPFFFDIKKDKQIKKVFAVSYKGNLYFQLKTVLKNRNKEDKALEASFPNGFTKVLIGGNNYLYFEAPIVNKWKNALALNLVENSKSMIGYKGGIWDFENNEFNIFRSCKDFNDFVEGKISKVVQDCEMKEVNLEVVRQSMETLK